jgi:maltooligosyltrehalose trehalohydrolase
MSLGAEPMLGGGVHFRLWAPKRQRAEVVVEGGSIVALHSDPDGYFSGEVSDAGPGTLYRFRLDGSTDYWPDPASRFQPEGPHGPSLVIDPDAFHWSDQGWPGIRLEGQVIYETHIGTFTKAGTYAAAREQLRELKDFGITCIEIMPIAEFPGEFGWGYDGVDLFAPAHIYGTPDDLKQLVDDAHKIGLAVILDVVYNHLGPDGNYLKEFSDWYFSDRNTEWGEALNFDGSHSEDVREFFIENAAYWIREFHFDGLRLDATQQIIDESPTHVLVEIGRAAREAAGSRSIILVNENEPQHAKLVRPVKRGGYGLDALWNDDLHHSAVVALTGKSQAYYSDTAGRPQEFISAAKYGYLFQGQRYSWQKQRRGTPALDLDPAQFVVYLENHDQVANTGRGQRMHQMTSLGRLKAMTAYILLLPGTPMLFQGQEFASSAPFLYFADHNPELSRKVNEGRLKFLAQFPNLGTQEMQQCFAKPNDRATFERCKLDFGERKKNADIYRMHRDLLRLRREDKVFRAQKPRSLDGAVLAEEAFLIRYFGENGDDCLVLVNLGRDLNLHVTPEPLLAGPEKTQWSTIFSTESPDYGGCGTSEVQTENGWQIPAEATVVLKASPQNQTQVDAQDKKKI